MDYTGKSIVNLKIRNHEFCVLWDCKKLNKEYPCASCPVLKDLSEMAKALLLNSSSFGVFSEAA